MEKKSRGTVQISIEEFEYLTQTADAFRKLLSSDKCVQISDNQGFYPSPRYVINAAPEMKELEQVFKRQKESIENRYWKLRRIDKRVSIFDIGKRLGDLVDK
jgi:hypothetical protein